GLPGLLSVLLAEAFDATGLVDQLLLPGEERVAVRADVEVHLAVGGAGSQRGTRLPLGVAAVAVELANFVDGMDPGLHDNLLNGGVPGPASRFRGLRVSGAPPRLNSGGRLCGRRVHAVKLTAGPRLPCSLRHRARDR